MMTESRAVKKGPFGRVVAIQPGSTPKKWDQAELVRCGAIGTTERRFLDLRGEVHPVFGNWVGANPELRRELEQPLLLASRIVESAGLPWLSDFLVEDIFGESYPGREPSRVSGRAFVADDNRAAPRTIVRHHRAPWATPELKRKWLVSAQRRLRNELASSITWQLDADMFPEKGWAGYTCRHPRGHLALGELDRYETIQHFDRTCKDRRYREMSVLVTAEYPRRLAELRRRGLAHGEEYLLTAFMTTITILHELGHAVYWKDCRSLTRHMQEPFYGGDLEMELGDSFIAAVFGGWVPVPIREAAQLQGAFSFENGLSWRQSLNWDHHRIRPKHRTHYSIPVDYVAKLFDEESWFAAGRAEKLIRPHSLAPRTTVGLPLLLPPQPQHPATSTASTIAITHQHASAALPDFHRATDGWSWNRRPGARFRIPQYDGCVSPDLDLPTATDDVIREPAALDPRASSSSLSSRSSQTGGEPQQQQQQRQSPRRFSLVATKKDKRASKAEPVRNRDGDGDSVAAVGTSMSMTPAVVIKMTKTTAAATATTTTIDDLAKMLPEKEEIPRVRLGLGLGPGQSRSRSQKVSSSSSSSRPDRAEISVDELKKRLSQIIGVSLAELEKLFENPPCT